MSQSKTTEQADVSGVPAAIREQVILPWPVAIRITLRGLKIRLGRSLITMSGVVLGIAFLMSVLTGDGLKSGLAAETRTKTEVTRLVKLVEDEVGALSGRRIGVVVNGPLEDRRVVRMLQRLAAQADEGAMVVFSSRADAFVPGPDIRRAEPFERPAFRAATEIEDVFRNSDVVLLLCRQLPSIDNAGLLQFLGLMSQPVLLDYYPGRIDEKALRTVDERVACTTLTYEATEEEQARLAKQHRDRAARQLWITVVSILVTVIGISNAMLMSVTERIREIGTMKCLGALSGFVVKLFLIESFLIGIVGAVVGTLLGFLVPFIAYMLSAGMALLWASAPFGRLLLCGAGSVGVGTTLAIVAAIYPAVVAAKMVPADALRTNV